MAAASPAPIPAHPNPLVLDGLAISVQLWSEGPDAVISAISLASPRATPPYTWASRAGRDRDRIYRVVAYVEFNDGVLQGGWIIVTKGGRWELRVGEFDGFQVDLRRLVPVAVRQRVGGAVFAVAKPALRAAYETHHDDGWRQDDGYVTH